MEDVELIVQKEYEKYGKTKEEMEKDGFRLVYQNGHVVLESINKHEDSLFEQVSNTLNYELTKELIPHTKREICLIRNQIIGDLNKVNISEKNYHAEKDQIYVINWTKNRINQFYK